MTFDIDKILIVIPLFNHAATVREVAERALAIHDRVLVVDDGSSDGGAGALQGLGVQVLREEINKGKGAAIMIAAREAARMGMTHLVTLDADGQHDPADLQQLFKVLREEPFSIVVGKRDFDTSNVPGSSRFGRKFSNFWLRLQTGRSLEDTQSGFRAYPLAVLEGLKLKETRYSFEIEVLVKAAWAGVPLRDAEISVYYPPADIRVSHFDKFKDNLRLTLLNTHLTMRSILPWPHRKIVCEAKSPKVSLFRPLDSIRSLLTENTSPGRLAAAGALGVFLGAAPLIACHTIAVLLAAGFFRLNKVAAISASQLCMPPLVPALCIEAGYFMRHGEFLTELSWQTLGHQGFERLYEWLIGSLLVGPLLAAVVGAGIYATAILVKREKVPADG
jgi:glycosyltransferase involved in cell wall biosynthesis